MSSDRILYRLPLMPVLAVGPAHAIQNEGLLANATAMILMLLGLLALFLGARNLRVLQNKHALPKKRIPRNDKPFNRPEDVRPEIQR